MELRIQFCCSERAIPARKMSRLKRAVNSHKQCIRAGGRHNDFDEIISKKPPLNWLAAMNFGRDESSMRYESERIQTPWTIIFQRRLLFVHLQHSVFRHGLRFDGIFQLVSLSTLGTTTTAQSSPAPQARLFSRRLIESGRIHSRVERDGKTQSLPTQCVYAGTDHPEYEPGAIDSTPDQHCSQLLLIVQEDHKLVLKPFYIIYSLLVSYKLRHPQVFFMLEQIVLAIPHCGFPRRPHRT